MVKYSTYTWDLVPTLKLASPAFYKRQTTFIDSIRVNNQPEKSKETRNEIQLPTNRIVYGFQHLHRYSWNPLLREESIKPKL